MSVFRWSGLIRKPNPFITELISQAKAVNLFPVKKVTYTFDPFHKNAATVREVMWVFSGPKIRETNYKTVHKINVVCDNSEPTIECQLENGKTLLFKTGNLTPLEVFQQYNKYILPLVPPPQDITEAPKTKSQKKK